MNVLKMHLKGHHESININVQPEPQRSIMVLLSMTRGAPRPTWMWAAFVGIRQSPHTSASGHGTVHGRRLFLTYTSPVLKRYIAVHFGKIRRIVTVPSTSKMQRILQRQPVLAARQLGAFVRGNATLASPKGPLSGLRVVDMSRVLAGVGTNAIARAICNQC